MGRRSQSRNRFIELTILFILGVYQFSDGKEYHGGWSKDVQHGFGKIKIENEVIQEGRWENGKFVE
jgi:hypothetical protein